MLKRHWADDARPDSEQAQREVIQAAHSIRVKARKIRRWLEDNDDEPGKSRQAEKSNITDNDSVKMKTGKGMIRARYKKG